MKAKLIAVGERAPRWVAEGFEEYRKRLSHWLPLELVEVEPGVRGKNRDVARATADEGARVLRVAEVAAGGHARWSRTAVELRATGAAAGALARAGSRPGAVDRRPGRSRRRGAGARGRIVVAGPADPAAHAGTTGRRRAVVPGGRNAGEPSLPPRLAGLCRSGFSRDLALPSTVQSSAAPGSPSGPRSTPPSSGFGFRRGSG